MFRKRGQTEVHFHWIFVLIAGAIILTFFVSIVVKQKDISETKSAGKAISGLEQIFTAAGVTEDTLTSPDIPDIELELICEEDYSAYTIKKTEISDIQIPTEIIFSPDLVRGDNPLIWTLPWNMPFSVDNFIMITSPQVRYLIVYSSGRENEASVIFEDIPDQINKERVHISGFSGIADKGNYKIKLVFVAESDIQSTITLPDWMEETDVSAVRIANQLVQFYEMQGNKLVSSSPADSFAIRPAFPQASKDPMVYGAVFAENAGMYRCAMKKAFKRLGIISEIYGKRTEKLSRFYENMFLSAGIPYCEQYYSSGYYPALSNIALQCSSAQCDFNALYSKAFEIQEENGILAENTDCPLIY
jgi:hypothetical protein